MAATLETAQTIQDYADDGYKYGFVTDIETESAPKGLNEDIIRFISAKKKEPEWMLESRLKAVLCGSFLSMVVLDHLPPSYNKSVNVLRLRVPSEAHTKRCGCNFRINLHGIQNVRRLDFAR